MKINEDGALVPKEMFLYRNWRLPTQMTIELHTSHTASVLDDILQMLVSRIILIFYLLEYGFY